MKKKAFYAAVLMTILSAALVAEANDLPCDDWHTVVIKGPVSHVKIVVPQSQERPPYYVFNLQSSFSINLIGGIPPSFDMDRLLDVISFRKYIFKVDYTSVRLTSFTVAPPNAPYDPPYVILETGVCQDENGHTSISMRSPEALVVLENANSVIEWKDVQAEALKRWKGHTPRIEIEKSEK